MDSTASAPGSQFRAAEQAGVVPEWLTYKQAEHYAALSRNTLWTLAKDSQIEARKVGSRGVRIRRESLDNYMRRQPSVE